MDPEVVRVQMTKNLKKQNKHKKIILKPQNMENKVKNLEFSEKFSIFELAHHRNTLTL